MANTSAEVETYKISDIARVVTGSTPSKNNPEHWGHQVPFLTPSDQAYGVRTPATQRFLSEVGAESFERRIIPPGATALTCIGATIGKISLVNQPTVTNQQINSVVAKEGTDPLYLYYKLSTCKDDLVAMASGSATPIVSKKLLESMIIKLPSLEEQKQIAEILGSLDDKIEANSRLLNSLYQFLRELYLFEVSKNNNVVLLTNIADFVNGKAFTKDATGTGRMVVRIAELNNGPGASTVYNDIENVDEKNLVNAGELLMSWSGSLGVFLWSREEAIVNQHIFKVIPKSSYTRGVVYCALDSVIKDFQEIAKDKATTMGHIKRGDLETEVRIPINTSEIEDIFSQISFLERENISLTQTRDLLIRQLIG